MADQRLRIRGLLSKQFTVVVVVLVVLVLMGGWLTYSAHKPVETTTDQPASSSWEQTTSFDHQATVVEETSVFQEGTTLTNQPLYFTQIAPELNGAVQTSYDANEDSQLAQTVSLSLVVREVEQRDQGSDATVYWETTEQLTTETVESVSPGEEVTVPFSQNMNAVETELDQVQDELGSSVGETEVLVRATVQSTGTVNGEAVNETTQYTLPIRVERNTYRVVDSGPITEQHGSTQPATIEESTDSTASTGAVGGPLLLVLAAGLLVGLLTIGRPEPLSEAEQSALTYENDRETFDEWISTIKLPAAAFELPRAEAASLGELVEFAIDTDNSVIEDPDEEVYYVPHDGYLYYYRPSFDTSSTHTQAGDEPTEAESATPASGTEHVDEPTEPSTETNTD